MLFGKWLVTKMRNGSNAAFFFFFFSAVSYVRRTGQHQWRCSDITFHCASQGVCDQWIEAINEQLSLLSKYSFSDVLYQLR